MATSLFLSQFPFDQMTEIRIIEYF
jgi:hypothetical protein